MREIGRAEISRDSAGVRFVKDHLYFELPCIVPYRPPRRHGRKYFNPLSLKKQECQWDIESQMPAALSPIRGPLRLRIDYLIKTPIKVAKKDRNVIQPGLPCLKKIDLDNLAKFSLDVLKGIVFDDDSQIWHLELTKRWAEINLTTITIWPTLQID